MFYSEGQPAQQMANLDYENKVDNRFKKKNIISSSNMNQYRSNQKLAA